jgi:hypothetical protein
MAAAVTRVRKPASATVLRHHHFRSRHRKRDLWVGATGLLAALFALPLSPQAHSPEVAAILAMSAVALLAGHRWAIALVVMSELLLVPTLWPRLLVRPPDLLAYVAVVLACLSALPGMLAVRRAAAVMVVVAGVKRTPMTCRAATFAMALAFAVSSAVALVA